jgi:hypothetical protein
VLVAGEGVCVALTGLATGVLAAWIPRQSVESMLFGVAPEGILTFGGVALLFGVVALLARLFARTKRRAHRFGRGPAHGVARSE